jgi:hypothetical protein
MEKIKIEFRIREEIFEDGKNHFYPESSYRGGLYANLAHRAFGFNDNGNNYSLSFDEALEIINKYKQLSYSSEKVVKEIIHKIE